MDHAKFSCSSSKRWMTCPGSIRASEGMPRSPSSKAARMGTTAHHLFEQRLITRKPPTKDLIGHVFEGEKVDAEMVIAVGEAMKPVLFRMKQFEEMKLHPELMLEKRIDLNFLANDFTGPMFGTSDVNLLLQGQSALVGDLKYGVHEVEAVENSQLMLYMLGLCEEYDWFFDDLILEIYQPRLQGKDAQKRKTWVVSQERLEAFEQEVREAISIAERKNAPRVAGDHCTFCPAYAKCKTRQEFAMGQARIDFSGDIVDGDGDDTPVLPSLDDISDHELFLYYKHAGDIRSWLKKVEDYVYQQKRAKKKSFPSLKFIRGKGGNRKWDLDESKLVRRLAKAGGVSKDDLYLSTLMSPKQAEAIIDPAVINKYCTQSEGALRLVDVDHAAPAVTDAQNDFADDIDDPDDLIG